MESIKTIAAVLAASLLAGCATEEYRRAETECAIDAYQQYPVVNQPMLRTDTRPVLVPSGRTICTTNNNRTICDQVMETRYETYQYWATVDVNAPARDNVIRSCAANLCAQRFGNAECKEPR
jgi:hypothetical protein